MEEYSNKIFNKALQWTRNPPAPTAWRLLATELCVSCSKGENLMLRIHFLNVGHGDCCIIEFIDNSRVAMIDINRTSEMDENSAKEIYESLSISSAARLMLASGSKITSSMLKSAGYDIKLQDPIEYLYEKRINSIFRFISTHPHIGPFIRAQCAS